MPLPLSDETLAGVFSPRVGGVVLAGGTSRRMGQDKALLTIQGRTMLERVVEVLAPLTDELVIVGRTELPESLAGLRCLPDQFPGTGPLGGIATAFRQVDAGVLLTVACDLPWLSGDVLRHLLTVLPLHDAAVPVVAGKPQPLYAAYARSIQPALREHVTGGSLRITDLLARSAVRWVMEDELRRHDPTLQSFFNANTPEDWAQAPFHEGLRQAPT